MAKKTLDACANEGGDYFLGGTNNVLQTNRRENIKTKQENESSKIIFGYILFTSIFYSFYLLLLLLSDMAKAENETHSDDLPVLQPLPPTHFVNENTCSSQKHQEQSIKNTIYST